MENYFLLFLYPALRIVFPYHTVNSNTVIFFLYNRGNSNGIYFVYSEGNSFPLWIVDRNIFCI